MALSRRYAAMVKSLAGTGRCVYQAARYVWQRDDHVQRYLMEKHRRRGRDMNNRDYYEIMGLDPDADGPTVEQQYWSLAKTYNSSEDPQIQAKLDDLNEAYGVLGTPRLREQYDAFRLEVERAQGGRGRSRNARSVRAGGRGLLGGLRLPLVGKAPEPPVHGDTFLPQHADSVVDEPVVEALVSAAPVLERSAPAAVAERAGRTRTRRTGTQELRDSTAAMLGRWRESIASRTPSSPKETEPDGTLVEIFRSEQAVEEPDEPLTAALDVLRGSGKTLIERRD
jgi:curved DNA-binding protein CbpA